MILVVGGIKGGSGKTTLATNLCVMRSVIGKKVLLVDTDEQRSASDWSDQRMALDVKTPWTTIQLFGRSVHLELSKLSHHYDDIIIDAVGRESYAQRSSLSIADKFLVPFRPKSLDVWTLGKVNELISEVTCINGKIKCYAVINQADFIGCDNKDAWDALSECPDLICSSQYIGYRKAFSSAAARGLGISELKPTDKKALREMNSLYQLIYS